MGIGKLERSLGTVKNWAGLGCPAGLLELSACFSALKYSAILGRPHWGLFFVWNALVPAEVFGFVEELDVVAKD